MSVTASAVEVSPPDIGSEEPLKEPTEQQGEMMEEEFYDWSNWEQLAEIWLLLEDCCAEDGLTVFCSRVLLQDRDELLCGIKGIPIEPEAHEKKMEKKQPDELNQDDEDEGATWGTGKVKAKKPNKKKKKRETFTYIKVILRLPSIFSAQ